MSPVKREARAANPSLYNRVVSLIASKAFFLITMGLFAFGSVWIAFSGRYPMAFDEAIHLGTIQLYAKQFSPFLSHQPANSYYLGAVTRDPSYLYHYLMSWPWRLITHLTSNFSAQVVSMRLINVILFGAGIILLRRLLKAAKVPPALANLALLLFVLTPLTSQVAAQINYDNLLMPLTMLSLLMTLDVATRLKAQRPFLVQLALLLSLGLLTSLVKYAFLPIFVAIGIYLLWSARLRFKSSGMSTIKQMKGELTKLHLIKTIGLVLVVLVSAGLFFERYGINTIRYETPIPECNQVLSIKQCSSYSAWERNYVFGQTKVGRPDSSVIRFTYSWTKQMGYNLLFALNGSESNFAVGDPLPLPTIAAIGIGVVGSLCCLYFWRQLLHKRAVRFFALIIAVYCAALWLQNYTDYMHLGQLVAVQGRYLLPVLVFIYVNVGFGFQQLLHKLPEIRLGLMTAVLICFMAGGGALTYILHSDPSWYMPSSKVVTINQKTQRILGPIIPGGRNKKSSSYL